MTTPGNHLISIPNKPAQGRLGNEHGTLFRLGGRLSCMPCYWVARDSTGKITYQTGENGEVTEDWRTLDAGTLDFFGVRCQHGLFGIEPHNGTLVLGPQRLSLGVALPTADGCNVACAEMPGNPVYSRRVVCDASGNLETRMVTVGWGTVRLHLRLSPNFEVTMTHVLAKETAVLEESMGCGIKETGNT